MSKSAGGSKRDSVIEVLNKARAMELQAIHQYMNQHYGLDDMDYGELAAQMKLIAIDEMRHAEMFAERLKELGGEPTAEMAGAIVKGEKVEAIFVADTAAEEGAIDAYNAFLHVCNDSNDSTSVKLFEAVIDEEQAHLNYFDNVREHIESLDGAYLAQKAGTPSATGLNTQGFVARQGGGA